MYREYSDNWVIVTVKIDRIKFIERLIRILQRGLNGQRY